MGTLRYNIILDKIKDKKNAVGAEIGVNKGITTDFLLKNKPDLKMIAVDPYRLIGYDEYYPSGSGARQHSFKKQEQFDLLYESTKKLLSVYGNRVELIRESSISAGELVDDGSLDFVFIDANHVYEHVLADILMWSKKVKMDGYIMGHDYNENDFDTRGICNAVNAVFDSNELNFGSDHCWWAVKTRNIMGR